eukprot:8588972-Pyramimonas_sp.AAC.1
MQIPSMIRQRAGTRPLNRQAEGRLSAACQPHGTLEPPPCSGAPAPTAIHALTVLSGPPQAGRRLASVSAG